MKFRKLQQKKNIKIPGIIKEIVSFAVSKFSYFPDHLELSSL